MSTPKFPFGCDYQRERTKVAPNLWSSRDRAGFLNLDNKKIFLGYTQQWVRKDGRTCFRVHCWSAGSAHFTITKNVATKAQAERRLIKYGRELRRVDHLDIHVAKDGWHRIVNESTRRPIKINDEWKNLYPTNTLALNTIRRLSRVLP